MPSTSPSQTRLRSGNNLFAELCRSDTLISSVGAEDFREKIFCSSFARCLELIYDNELEDAAISQDHLGSQF